MADKPGSLKGKKQEMEEEGTKGEEIWGGEEDRLEREEEGGRGEEKRKVGRPTNGERLMRERADSLPIGTWFKRAGKRKERQDEGEEGEGVEGFKRSTKLERSPVKKEEGGWMEVVKEMRAGFKEIMKEVKELREGKEEMKRWMEEMRKGWEKEKEGLEKRMDNIEKKMEDWESREREREEDVGDKRGSERGVEERKLGGNWEEMEGRMRKLELEGEMRKREERKRNIIIKGVEVKREGLEGLKEVVEEIVKQTGVVAKIEGIRRIGKKDGAGREMVWVKLASVKEKIEVMKGKRNLRDRREWILDDLTDKERKIEWLIKREAERKRREGMRVRIGFMKMWVEGELWVWDEGRESLRISKGEGGGRGKKKEGRREGEGQRRFFAKGSGRGRGGKKERK